MLKLPQIEFYKDPENEDFRAVLYEDDIDWKRFYAIPEVPRVRLDRNGNPVFLLTKYALSDQERNDNPDLPKGGGYMLFDVELGIPKDSHERLMEHLNEMVKERWLKRFGGRPPSENAEPPKAMLATPEWTDGKTNFYLVDDPNLVKGRLTGQQPSLIGSNTAIFNATLTPDGADFMEATLVNTDGEGGTDLANVQVQYMVKFLARLPPARISAWGRAEEIHRAVSAVWHDYEGRGCNEDISATTESYWQYMKETQAVGVKIDTGLYKLDDDAMSELRNFVMSSLTQWITDTMLDKIDPMDPSFPDMEDIYSSTDDVYRLKSINQVAVDRFDMNVEVSSITEKQLFPQATLQTFFSGRSADEMKRFVRRIRLGDDFWKELRLDVRVFAPWDGKTIKFVEVDVDYQGEVESFTFHPGDIEAKHHKWSLIDNKRDYKYRYKVVYNTEGEERSFESGWKTENTRDLNISVAQSGDLAVEVMSGNIDWKNIVDQVQVELLYGDPSNDVPEESYTVKLTEGDPGGLWERTIFAPRERPIRYRQKFFLKDDQEVIVNEKQTAGERIIINEPLVSTLKANFVTAGDMTQAKKVVLDVFYDDDDNDYHKSDTFYFETDDDSFTWKVLLRDPDNDTFRYRFTVIPKDPDRPVYYWPSEDGMSEKVKSGSTKVLDWPSPAKLAVTVRNRQKFSDDGVQELEVVLSTDHAMEGEDDEFSFVFDPSTKDKPTWEVLLDGNEPAKQTYKWEVRYFLADREEVKTGTSDRRSFFVPQLQLNGDGD